MLNTTITNKNNTYEKLQKVMNMKITIFGLLLLMLLVVALPGARAALTLDNIQFDPAVIASGDEVDIVIEYHDDRIPIEEERIGDANYSFRVELRADDDLTEEFVRIVDREGDDIHGTIFSGERYNKVFRVKVKPNAPAGNYEFRLLGQWYKDDEPLDFFRDVRFKMPVKREGIILDFANMQTQPAEVRPGDDYVKIVGALENVGEKYAKSVEVTLQPPQGIDASYTNNNRLWAGRVDSTQQKDVTFFVDIDEDMQPGLHNISYEMNYMDSDDTEYVKTGSIPFRIKPRPYLEVVNVSGEALAGQTAQLEVVIKNNGQESAESVDVRIMKQNAQPFVIDVRSDYVGELEPGETGRALFDIKVTNDAHIKDHDLSVLIRAKGDSDEGDDNIYLFNRQATLPVTGKAPNTLVILGAVALVGVGGVALYQKKTNQRTKRGKRK